MTVSHSRDLSKKCIAVAISGCTMRSFYNTRHVIGLCATRPHPHPSHRLAIASRNQFPVGSHVRHAAVIRSQSRDHGAVPDTWSGYAASHVIRRLPTKAVVGEENVRTRTKIMNIIIILLSTSWRTITVILIISSRNYEI